MAGSKKKQEVIIESDEKMERAKALREKVVRARGESELITLQAKEIATLKDELGDLNELNKQLDLLRRGVAVDSRRKDLLYIRKLDVVIDTVLSGIIDNQKELLSAINKMLKKGDMRGMKDLMVAFGVAVDKRESLLGFDETRHMKKRRMNLKVVFKGADGSQAGVSVEQEG